MAMASHRTVDPTSKVKIFFAQKTGFPPEGRDGGPGWASDTVGRNPARKPPGMVVKSL